MKNIQLIASDIDGTLLLNGSQAIDPEIFNLIHKLQQKDILFMAASCISLLKWLYNFLSW